MTRSIPVLAILAAGALAVACTDSDADITAKVKTEIETDRSISSASHIEVSTRKKIVALNGRAESQVARQRADALARATDGVVGVSDRLTVVPAQAQLAPNTTASAAPARRAPDDAAITSAIQSKLRRDRRVAGAKIDVETHLGIVTLTGTVRSERVQRDAMQIAEDTAGVQRVENRLKVRNS